MRERFSAAPRLGPRPVGGLGQGSGVLQDTAPSPSVHLLIQGSISYLNPHLLPHSPPNDHHSANSWLNSLSNGCSLTVGGLWEGSLQRRPMVERDLLPGNRVGRNGGLVTVLR